MSEDTNREEQTTKKKTKKTKQGEMSFLEHLEEFRWHIVRSAMAIFAFAIVAFIMKDFIFDTVILNPRTPDFWTNRMFAKLGDLVGSEALKINQEPLELISIKIAGQFSMHIWTSIIAGFLLASPVVFYEFWRFVKPALYDKEKKHASGAVFYTSALFMMGVLFGYYLIVPLSVHFLGTYNVSSDVANQINLKSYIGSVTSISMAAGVVFLLPIFSYFLSKVGILTPQFMKTYRKHAYVVMLLLSAVITPPDIFSQVMVCFPLVFLYEIGIMISRRVVKKREKELEEN
ncbi:MAG: twin-arginine translocase subunit TatC [Prolixibacteraceae bacterium]|jgi:sec-independent protein translocase protein TatC|nr:twin-arginine translocase subunit TatC [Prolixibacteraceae bacterium]MBT6764512.1 twin-arginine translocase subunit TatC [Prolixibacteraceae bacterium]MBT6997340.1 twin-arginine translocase subunit TatC [Prolixibacteraceae bacterium]MBT7397529.1 twin-arginine translocase subunit TatC [Prolixibacteraceae bacterium]